jgi:hypothetical protein
MFYLRMIYAHHCFESGISKRKIALDFDRPWQCVHRMILRYKDEVIGTKEFRVIANAVNYHLFVLTEKHQEPLNQIERFNVVGSCQINENNAKLACETNVLGKSDTNVHQTNIVR